MEKRLKEILTVLFLLLIIALALFAIVYINEYKKIDELKVVFFDVGQGDSIYIETPGGSDILIDGGPDNKILDKLGREMPFWDRSLDLVILTHPHADHVNGLVEVLTRYKVEEILYTGVNYNNQAYYELKEIIQEKNIKVTFAIAGQDYEFDNNIKLEILYPFKSLQDVEVKEVNNSSIVTLLDYNETEFLLTGDLEKEGELELIKKYQDLSTEVLKAGHHGSKSSSSLELLRAVSPEYVVIQSGKDNSFNHPHEITLNRLQNLEIDVLRNDSLGNIEFTTNGEAFKYMVK